MSDWRTILVAVDEMESSVNAMSYVGQVANNLDNISICLVHVYPEPPPDFFRKGGDLEQYQAQRIDRAGQIFNKGMEILTGAGVRRQDIYCTTHMAKGKTISETILDVRRNGDFGTVVVGKRGVSKAEEFLFGSISNTLARNCIDFATWIVG